MNNPKYKIGQEVFRIDLDNKKAHAVVVHKISEIRLCEDETIQYTMYMHKGNFGEDYLETYTYPEDCLYETVKEARDKWNSQIIGHRVKKLKKDIEMIEADRPYKKNSIKRAMDRMEEGEKLIKKNLEEIQELELGKVS